MLLVRHVHKGILWILRPLGYALKNEDIARQEKGCRVCRQHGLSSIAIPLLNLLLVLPWVKVVEIMWNKVKCLCGIWI